MFKRHLSRTLIQWYIYRHRLYMRKINLMHYSVLAADSDYQKTPQVSMCLRSVSPNILWQFQSRGHFVFTFAFLTSSRSSLAVSPRYRLDGKISRLNFHGLIVRWRSTPTAKLTSIPVDWRTSNQSCSSLDNELRQSWSTEFQLIILRFQP